MVGKPDARFLSGLIDGEAHFGIALQNGQTSHTCVMSLALRDDDQELLEAAQATTGLGTLFAKSPTGGSRSQTTWLIRTQSECARLMALLEETPLRSRKAVEFGIWSAAVKRWSRPDSRRFSDIEALRRQLLMERHRENLEWLDARPFRASTNDFWQWFGGFLCAEGHLRLTARDARATIKLRGDDRNVLEQIQRVSGLGKIVAVRPPDGNPQVVWNVCARAECLEIATRLRPEDVRGRKGREFAAWRTGVIEQCKAPRGTKPNLRKTGRAVAHLRIARSYRPPSFPLVESSRRPSRDLLSPLREAAALLSGSLTGTAYMHLRRQHPSWPARNTVARRYGSWEAALQAAGLDDRISQRASERAITAGTRAEPPWRAADRARALELVDLCERELGHTPRAMEFFTWRARCGLDGPTQASFYRLLPGGWPTVLAARDRRLTAICSQTFDSM